jgi:N-acetylmuramoyl-L-alanine amidase/putative methionine-R-sulfoxide reductase with GAF domain
VPAWPTGTSVRSNGASSTAQPSEEVLDAKPSQRDALQALLAFSALHDQVRRRTALATRHKAFDTGASSVEFERDEQFLLDEVLQLVAERAIAITGADGLAIALAEDNEIVLRASAGSVRPDVGARIDRDSAFSGASFRTAQIVICDDTETDARVNLQACRRLGARSMVAVPLCGRRRVIGLLEAFSSWPFGFNDSDVRNLSLLAELVVSALKPEDEDRFADSAQVAETKLEPPAPPVAETQVTIPLKIAGIEPPPPPAIAKPAEPIPSKPPVPVEAKPEPIIAKLSVAPMATKPAEPVVPKPPLPAAETKPVQTAAAKLTTPAPAVATTSAALAGILDELAAKASTPVQPAPKASALHEFEPPAELTAKPALSFGLGPEQASRRHAILIALICIVIVAAFSGGVWWKVSTARVSGMVVRPETGGSKAGQSATTPATGAENPTSGLTAATLPSEAGEASNAPATPQEMAKFPRVTGIRHWSSADSSTVVFDLEDQVQYEAHRLTGPDRIYFDLHDTQLATELAGKSIEVGDPLLNRIRAAQPVAGMTRVVLETRGNSNFSVSLEPNPYRLVVEVRKIGALSKGAVNLFPSIEAERNRLSIVVPPPTKEDLQLRARVPKMRIVVDAGHGGWDLGTVGRRGLLEKDLVLEIAERLGKLLETRLGMEVIYTRQDDNYIPLDERAEIANQAQADLFVSVHANYSDLPSARGVETYYTSTFSAPGSKEAGTKDVDGHAGNYKNSVNPTLSATDLREKIEQSRHLAASVQRSLYGALAIQNPGLRDRGIKEAGFVVLTESAMPGILAEVSFVSSPADEQRLRSDGYREQIAEALYKGIARYAASSKSVKVASTAK